MDIAPHVRVSGVLQLEKAQPGCAAVRQVPGGEHPRLGRLARPACGPGAAAGAPPARAPARARCAAPLRRSGAAAAAGARNLLTRSVLRASLRMLLVSPRPLPYPVP